MRDDVQRKCAACAKIQNRNNMIKITREHKSGEIIINPNLKIFGRSAYLCYNKSCIKDILKKNRLEKSLKTQITEDIKQKLETLTTECK